MRARRIATMVLGGVVALLGLLFAFLQTPPGQRALARTRLRRDAAHLGPQRLLPDRPAGGAHRAPGRAGPVAHGRERAPALVVRLAVRGPCPGRDAVGRARRCRARAAAADDQAGGGRQRQRLVQAARRRRPAGAVGRDAASRGAACRRGLALDAARRWSAVRRPARGPPAPCRRSHRRTVGQARGRYALRSRATHRRRRDLGRRGAGRRNGRPVAAA